MLEINVTLNAPELVVAIEKLAVALDIGSGLRPAEKSAADFVPAASPVQIMQQMQHLENPAPQGYASQTQTSPLPTSVPGYTQEQLARAAGTLMDAGRGAELVNLINSFGVRSLANLPKEQYGAFGSGLRQLGAVL